MMAAIRSKTAALLLERLSTHDNRIISRSAEGNNGVAPDVAGSAGHEDDWFLMEGRDCISGFKGGRGFVVVGSVDVFFGRPLFPAVAIPWGDDQMVYGIR